MHCSVFLIDYGRFLEGVVARLNVRALPKLMRVLPPQAFQIVLAGIISNILFFCFPFFYTFVSTCQASAPCLWTWTPA